MSVPKRSFLLVIIGLSLVDFFASLQITAITVALPSIRDQLGIPLAAAKNIIFAYLAMMLAALVFAIVNGSYLKKHVRPASLFFAGLSVYSLGSVLALLPGSFYFLLFALVMQGLGAGFSFVGQLSLISTRWKKMVGHIMPCLETAMAAGIVVGPLLGGLLAERHIYSFPAWRLIFAASAVASATALILFRLNYREKKEESRCEPEICEGRKNSRKMNYPAVLAIQGSVALASIGMSFVASIYLQDFKLATPLASGFIIFFASAGSVAGAWISRRRVGPISFIKEALAVITVGSILISLGIVSGWAWFLIAPISVFGLGMGMCNVALYVHFSKMDPDFRDNAMFLMFFQAGNILGVTISEAIIAGRGDGYESASLVITLFVVGAFLLGSRFLKRIDVTAGKELKVIRHDGISDETTAKRVFTVYEEAMEYANQVSPIQQSYTDWKEFKEVAANPEMITLTLCHRDEVIGMAMMTANIALVPWANSEYFKRKMSDKYSQRVIYYIKAINVLTKWRSEKRGAFLLKHIIHQIDCPHGVAIFDCSENATGDISRWVHMLFGDFAKIEPLDRQLFYVCSWDL